MFNDFHGLNQWCGHLEYDELTKLSSSLFCLDCSIFVQWCVSSIAFYFSLLCMFFVLHCLFLYLRCDWFSFSLLSRVLPGGWGDEGREKRNGREGKKEMKKGTDAVWAQPVLGQGRESCFALLPKQALKTGLPSVLFRAHCM